MTAEKKRIWELAPSELQDGELLDYLTERFTEDPVPPCRVCGKPLSIQACGGGAPTVWGCDGMETDPKDENHLIRTPGRKGADAHYSQSRFTQMRGGDSHVLELIRRFNAKSLVG